MAKFKPRFESHKTMKLNRESLTIPKEYAEIINQCDPPRCFVTIAPDRLLVYPMSEWLEFSDKLERSKSRDNRKLLHIYRKYGYITTALDSSNRIKVSAIHLTYLKNPKNLVIAGQGNHLEVYRSEDHVAELNKLMENEAFQGPEGVIFDED